LSSAMSKPMVAMSSFLEQFQQTTGCGATAFTIAIIVLAMVIIAPLFTLFCRRRQQGYPTPPGGLPFFGHGLSLLDTDAFSTVLKKWAKEVRKDRGGYEFRLFQQRWIVLCGSDVVMQAMRLRLNKL
jgi:hypothetical protein